MDRRRWFWFGSGRFETFSERWCFWFRSGRFETCSGFGNVAKYASWLRLHYDFCYFVHWRFDNVNWICVKILNSLFRILVLGGPTISSTLDLFKVNLLRSYRLWCSFKKWFDRFRRRRIWLFLQFLNWWWARSNMPWFRIYSLKLLPASQKGFLWFDFHYFQNFTRRWRELNFFNVGCFGCYRGWLCMNRFQKFQPCASNVMSLELSCIPGFKSGKLIVHFGNQISWSLISNVLWHFACQSCHVQNLRTYLTKWFCLQNSSSFPCLAQRNNFKLSMFSKR